MPVSTRRTLASGLISVLLVVISAVVVSPAHAVSAVTCTGTATTNFTPRLTMTSTNTEVHIKEALTSCAPAGIVTDGHANFTVTQDANCLVFVSTNPNTVTYKWDPSGKSTIHFNNTQVIYGLDGITTVTSTGTVTDGLFAGATATRVKLLTPAAGSNCRTTGVSEVMGTMSLTLLVP